MFSLLGHTWASPNELRCRVDRPSDTPVFESEAREGSPRGQLQRALPPHRTWALKLVRNDSPVAPPEYRFP